MWVVLFGTVIISFVIIYFMPPKISKKEMYITWFVIAAITLFVDIIIGASLDTFDYGTDKKPRIPETVIEVTLTPASSIIFLNFMPKKLGKFFLYVVGWTIFAILFEWICVKVGYLTYKNWRLIYSIPFYPLTSIFLRWHLHYIRK
jgi:hypothetical protein